MAQTRAKSNLASIHERIVNFIAIYRNPEKLKSLGWEPVPVIDVKLAATWIDATNVLMSSGYSQFVHNDWVVKPIALSNHQLFDFDTLKHFCKHFETIFVNTLREIDNEVDFKAELDNYFHVKSKVIPRGRESRIYEKLYSPNDEVNKYSWCYSLSVEGLVKFSVPKTLKQTKIDGIVQLNSWLTDGHIETGGDDSISVTLMGEKTLFYLYSWNSFH